MAPLKRSSGSRTMKLRLTALLTVGLGFLTLVSGNDSKYEEANPCIAEFVAPEYPPVARHQGYQGIVRIRVVLNDQGLWSEIQTLEGHPLFRDYALLALSQWRFCSCENSSRELVLTFRFLLNGEKTNNWAETRVELRQPATVDITTNPPIILSDNNKPVVQR